jgi:hypothetical protein
LLAGCSAAPAGQAESVPTVSIAEPTAPRKIADTPGVFSCKPARVGDTASIELAIRAFSSEGGARTDSSTATYDVQVLALSSEPARVQRARVTLRSLSVNEDRHQQMAWSTALEQAWVELETPFELSRLPSGSKTDGASDSRWCFVANATCRLLGASADEFAQALGETVLLLTLPDVVSALDDKPSDGNLKLSVSDSLLARASLGLPKRRSPAALQQGSGFPALFRFPLREEGASGDRGRGTTAKSDLDAKIKIDQACRLRELTTVLRVERAASPASQGQHRATHELGWTITPAW